MKKFTDISDKEEMLDFYKNKSNNTSDDIVNLDDQIESEVDGTKLEGEWEISSIIDVSKMKPDINEAIIINAELGDKTVKRGDEIYITALIHRKGSTAYHQQQMGVIKVRVVDIYNNLFILNSLRR
jgi:hypothetical protein